MLCSDRTKKLSSRASVDHAETLHNSLNSSLTEAANKQCTASDRLTPRALRYARRSAGFVEPADQPDRKTNSGTAKSPSASVSAPSASVSASKNTDLRVQSGRKRHRSASATSESRAKKAKKESPKSTPSTSSNSSHKSKQESLPKKQATRRQRTSKNVAVKKQTHRQTSLKVSNLERGKEKTAKSDKVSTKATAGQASVGATAAGSIPTKKRSQRSSATAAAVSAESSLDTVTGETSAGSSSQTGRTVRRRTATKRGGSLLTSSSHPTDTTGSCASSK